MRAENALQMTGISKRFPGVTALDSVDFKIAPGEVVALVGENGAGKSTLMKILAGIHQQDSGTIHLGGRPITIGSPIEASRHGIGIIHQEIELIETLDVASNVFLGREPVWGGPIRLVDSLRMFRETEQVLTRLGLPLSAKTRVADLSLGFKQMVEIARAISLKVSILIMDEPTSSLTVAETDRLLNIVQDLKDEGVAIIYISHRLAEVERIADRVVVLRDGKNAGALSRAEIDRDRMVQLMVGRDLKSFYSKPHSIDGDVAFEVRKLRTTRYPESEVSITIRRGEILGLAGLVGAGRSELAHAIFGADRTLAGEIVADGQALRIRSVRDAIARGIYLVPEDRRGVGLITPMTVRENVMLAGAGSDASAKACEGLQVKTPSLETPAANLSGGNQQKVVLAKWLALNPRVILFDEPTRGIDVGAKAEIYHLMRGLADRGVAILMISSDLEEILGNSDRVAVMHEGRITGVLEREECSQEAIMRLAVA